MKKINFKKGISLIETIIYIAIFSVFITALAQFSTTLTQTRLYQQGILEVNNQGSQVLKLITQNLRNGNSINSPGIGNNSSSLSIDTGVSETNPTVFSEIDGVLYITEGTNPSVALTNNKVTVSNLSFNNLSQPSTPNIIKIEFTLTSVSIRNPYSVTFSGSGALRK